MEIPSDDSNAAALWVKKRKMHKVKQFCHGNWSDDFGVIPEQNSDIYQ